MTTLLTVAIPHYNNVSGLLITLNEVLKQYSNSMEVIVIDNATGKSFNIVKAKFAGVCPKISFFKNKTNIGYDKNVELCVKKSRGKYVWLLGSGDIPQENAFKKIIKIIDENPQATNLLLNVITDPSPDKENYGDISATCQILEPTKNKLCLTDLYRSALSGNVVNRESWLKAAREPLAFDNWCHVERSLQMHSDSDRKPFSVNARHVGVFVARETSGWWNYDDLSFLQCVLQHRDILIYYSNLESFKTHHLPDFCKSLSLIVIKAMLYSRSIPKPSSAQQRGSVEKTIRKDTILFIIYKVIQLLPKMPLGTAIIFYKKLKNFTRQ